MFKKLFIFSLFLLIFKASFAVKFDLSTGEATHDGQTYTLKGDDTILKFGRNITVPVNDPNLYQGFSFALKTPSADKTYLKFYGKTFAHQHFKIWLQGQKAGQDIYGYPEDGVQKNTERNRFEIRAPGEFSVIFEIPVAENLTLHVEQMDRTNENPLVFSELNFDISADLNTLKNNVFEGVQTAPATQPQRPALNPAAAGLASVLNAGGAPALRPRAKTGPETPPTTRTQASPTPASPTPAATPTRQPVTAAAPALPTVTPIVTSDWKPATGPLLITVSQGTGLQVRLPQTLMPQKNEVKTVPFTGSLTLAPNTRVMARFTRFDNAQHLQSFVYASGNAAQTFPINLGLSLDSKPDFKMERGARTELPPAFPAYGYYVTFQSLDGDAALTLTTANQIAYALNTVNEPFKLILNYAKDLLFDDKQFALFQTNFEKMLKGEGLDLSNPEHLALYQSGIQTLHGIAYQIINTLTQSKETGKVFAFPSSGELSKMKEDHKKYLKPIADLKDFTAASYKNIFNQLKNVAFLKYGVVGGKQRWSTNMTAPRFEAAESTLRAKLTV